MRRVAHLCALLSLDLHVAQVTEQVTNVGVCVTHMRLVQQPSFNALSHLGPWNLAALSTQVFVVY